MESEILKPMRMLTADLISLCAVEPKMVLGLHSTSANVPEIVFRIRAIGNGLIEHFFVHLTFELYHKE